MTINEAVWDRIARVVLGIALIALVFAGPQTAWGWLGLVPLLTGLFGHCPVYQALGMRTCRPPAPPKGPHHMAT